MTAATPSDTHSRRGGCLSKTRKSLCFSMRDTVDTVDILFSLHVRVSRKDVGLSGYVFFCRRPYGVFERPVFGCLRCRGCLTAARARDVVEVAP
jgi:hypothetical protein